MVRQHRAAASNAGFVRRTGAGTASQARPLEASVLAADSLLSGRFGVYRLVCRAIQRRARLASDGGVDMAPLRHAHWDLRNPPDSQETAQVTGSLVGRRP